MDKTALRAAIRAKKQAMTPDQIEKTSTALAAMLYVHPFWQEAKTVCGYLSYNQEVRTGPILRRAMIEGKTVAVPKIVDGEMRFVVLRDLENVGAGYRGIPEPVADTPVCGDETALVLLPGLAFDGAGNRLGYGGGFYDRYLAAHRGHKTLALCYDFQLVAKLPTEEFDVPADVVLSAAVEG